MVTVTKEATEQVLERTFSNRLMRFTPFSELGRAVKISDAAMAAHTEAQALLVRRTAELNEIDRQIAAVAWDTDPAELAGPMNQREALRLVITKVQTRVRECELAIPNAGNVYHVLRRLTKALESLEGVTDDQANTMQSPAQRRQIADERRAEIEGLTGVRPE